MRVKITIEINNKGEVCPLSKKVEDMNPKELLLYSAAYCAALTLKGILDKEHHCNHCLDAWLLLIY